MDLPETLRYSTDHEWLRTEDGEAVVGITAYAAEELGDVVFVELPEIGRKLAKDEAFGVIESVKTASDLFAPAAGEVLVGQRCAQRRTRAGQQRALRGRLDGATASRRPRRPRTS